MKAINQGVASTRYEPLPTCRAVLSSSTGKVSSLIKPGWMISVKSIHYSLGHVPPIPPFTQAQGRQLGADQQAGAACAHRRQNDRVVIALPPFQ